MLPDISTNNFALGLRDLAGVSEEAMRQLLGEPELGHVSALDGSPLPASLPPYLVHPVDMTRLIPMSDSSMVKMIDLGEGQSKNLNLIALAPCSRMY